MKVRILTILGVLALGLGLTGAMLALAQGGAPAATPDAEEAAELAAAAALAADPGPLLAPSVRAGAVFTPPAVISAPLFVGADAAALFTYLVDPDTAAAHPLYDGFRVWGAAFDPISRTVYFNHGPNLYAWPLDGAPGGLGIVKHDTSGSNLSFYGLAHSGDALLGTMPLGSAAHPEGVYQIDPATLSATLVITYAAPADVDMGGLAANPDSGELYGTNDDTPQQGLVRINPDGTLTLLAPYPAGQSDIDGLAIGDGRAYLVPDQPGQIYVFDFATLTYTAPITNPWTTSELFSGADWISAPEVLTPTITLTKTVGSHPNTCAPTSAITLAGGGDVTYCYEVVNTGPITLTLHTLEDSELGGILDDFPYTLAPGASAFLTATTAITQTTVNTATWTAYNEGPTAVATATATATVTITDAPTPGIALLATVGEDPNECGTESALYVGLSSPVTLCFTVTNTGNITLTRHSLSDFYLGDVLSDTEHILAPGASFSITHTWPMVLDFYTLTPEWTAYNPGPTDVVTATDTVNFGPKVALIDVEPGSITATVEAGTAITQLMTINNLGQADLLYVVGQTGVCGPPPAWFSAEPANGVVVPGGSAEVTLTLDATGLTAGTYTATPCIGSNDFDQPIIEVDITLVVTAAPITEWVAHLPVIMGIPPGE